MKILEFKKDRATLIVENMDDLWYLSTIIEVGDTLEGKTFRKVKIGGSEDRSQSIVKKPVFLKIAVEKVEFHKYSDILRISGKVQEGKEDIPKDSYHTFSLEPGTKFTLIKPEWLKFHRQKLEESAKEESPSTLICVFDREDAYLALMKKYGYEVVAELHGQVQKKDQDRSLTKNFYEEIIANLKEYQKRYSLKSIVRASPSFWKEELLKNLKDQDLKKVLTLATCSSCDKGAINEVIKRPEVQAALSKDRVSKEMALVEQLLSEISKDDKAAYGVDETASAAAAGSIVRLLITDGFIQKSRQDDVFTPINDIMKTADRLGADIHIISSEHDGGRKLDGLGGIGAILRYKMRV